MRAYYFDDIPGDQRLLHDSGESLSETDLAKLGVLYWHIPLDADSETRIDELALKRGYKNRDTIRVTREGLGDQYEAKLKMFFEECVFLFLLVYPFTGFKKSNVNSRHMHEDEEIRYIKEGSGFFDVRGSLLSLRFFR